MNSNSLFLILFTVLVVSHNTLLAQNLHTHANAASISNEINGTNGWGGNANFSSTNVNPFQGAFAISARSTSTIGPGKEINYTFPAVVGQVYDISIWARRGAQSSAPAFANWIGFSNFTTTLITNSNWTQYTWSLTATSTNPRIRVYAAAWAGAQIGDEVLIDNVSIIQQGGDAQAPNAVTDLASSNTTDTATDLSWTDPGDNVGVVDYEVFQDGVSIGTTGGATTLNVTGLTASTSYDFTVFARDAANNTSGVSNTATVVTQAAADAQAPNAVTDLASSNTTDTATDLSWTDPGDNVGVVDYEVFQDGVSIGTTGGATTLNVTGLTASTSYDFTVFARDAANNTSGVSNTATVVTQAAADAQAPNAVTDLASSNTTDTATDLSWTDPGDNVGVVDYEVFQDGVSIGTTGGATTLNVTGLTASTSYDFTVFARDAANNTSGVSNTATVVTQAAADAQAPNAVTDLASSNTTDTATDLSWTDPGDNVGVVDYEVFQDGVSIGTTGGATTLNVTGLTASTSYDFTVFARDAANNTSGVSNTATVVTQVSGFIDFTSLNSNLPTVDWQAQNMSVAQDLLISGSVGIGTATPGSALEVVGNIISTDILVSDEVYSPTWNGTLSVPTKNAVFDKIEELSLNLGDVSKVGTPADNQIGVWTGDGTIEGNNSLTFNGTEILINGTPIQSSSVWSLQGSDTFYSNGNVGIGTSTIPSAYRLAVAGGIIAEEIQVQLQSNWPDFVFDKEYELPTLDQVRAHIDKKGYLPNMPSAQEVEQNGINLGEMNARLLQKIEELTLYILEQDRKIQYLEKRNIDLEAIRNRLDSLEKQLLKNK